MGPYADSETGSSNQSVGSLAIVGFVKEATAQLPAGRSYCVNKMVVGSNSLINA